MGTKQLHGVVIALMCIGLTVCAVANPNIGATTVNEPTMMKTICAGRLQLDIPVSSRTFLSATYRKAVIKHDEHAISFEKFLSDVEARASSLRNNTMSAPVSPLGKLLDKENPHRRSAQQLIGLDIDRSESQVAISYHETTSSASGIVTELHQVTAGRHLFLMRKDSGADVYPKAKAELVDVAGRFRPSAQGTIPTGNGFCIDGGVFDDQGNHSYREEFTLTIEFPDHPDARLTIDSRAIDRPDDEEPLSKRADRDLGVMRAQGHGVDVLGRGAKDAAGQHGYEIGISAAADVPNGRIRKFFWGAAGVPKDVNRPALEVDLTIEPSEGMPSTFADDASARAFWNSVLGSIRIRAGG